MCDVDRREQHDAAHNGEQDHAGGSGIVHAVAKVCDSACTAIVIVGRIGRLQGRSNRGHLFVCLRGGCARREAANEIEPAELFRGEIGRVA